MDGLKDWLFEINGEWPELTQHKRTATVRWGTWLRYPTSSTITRPNV